MESEPELLADAIGSIVDKVVLDPATLEAVVSYKIASLTGNKVASPRGFEADPIKYIKNKQINANASG